MATFTTLSLRNSPMPESPGTSVSPKPPGRCPGSRLASFLASVGMLAWVPVSAVALEGVAVLEPEAPIGEVLGRSLAGQPGPNIYYTYKFTNSARVPIEVSFVDALPSGLVWDPTFLPVIKHPLTAIPGDGIDLDELVAGVVYAAGNVEARVDALRIPPGSSELTLRTQPTQIVGEILNDATIRFGSGAKFTIAATANVRLADPVPFVRAFALSGVPDYSVLAVGTSFKLSGSDSTVSGDVGIGSGVSQDIGTGVITGNYFYHPPASGAPVKAMASQDDTAVPVVAVAKDLSAEVSEALDFAARAAALEPTQEAGRIENDLTISSEGGTNVILIDSIKLSGHAELTLQGAADDYFVLNIREDAQITGGSRIVLTGGLPPDHVLINLLPGATKLETATKGEIVGAVLAVHPGNSVKIAGGTPVRASIAAYEVDLTGNSTLSSYRFR